MRYLPLAVDLRDRRVVVVGGGEVAERKVQTLLACDAKVQVIAPALTDRLHELRATGAVVWEARAYRGGDLAGAMLAVAATDDDAVNRRVADEAASLGVWCNVASPPEAGNCQVMATVDLDGVTLGISTAGLSPYVARRVRETVEAAVPREVGRLAALIGELRDTVQERVETLAERRAVYDRMWSSRALALLRAGDETGARAALRECLGAWPTD